MARSVKSPERRNGAQVEHFLQIASELETDEDETVPDEKLKRPAKSEPRALEKVGACLPLSGAWRSMAM
jgi:hypothetical protein